MSLVICSNNFKDGSTARQKSSIDNAFSFRNALSSTYSIPKNSQVALQSAKLNINGKVVYSSNTNNFYQYFGKKLDMDGTTSPQISETTSSPLLVQLTGTDRIVEESPSDFANSLTTRLNESIYHPNMINKLGVEVLNNASSLDFKGYKITYDQLNTKSAATPSDNTFVDSFRPARALLNGSSPEFTYAGGVFTRNASLNASDVCAGINKQRPLNLGGGEMEVNISSANANVNVSGTEVEWAIGLSRVVNNVGMDGYLDPTYYARHLSDDVDVEMPLTYMDFGLARNLAGELVVFQTGWAGDGDGDGYLITEEVEYWQNDSSDFTTSRLDLSTGQYTKVKFKADGEKLKLEIFNASGAVGYQTLTEYDAGEPKFSMFTPINQAQWCLHPVFQVGQNASNLVGSISFEKYEGVAIAGYDPSKENKGGWYETMELLGTTGKCRAVESRDFNRTEIGTAYAQEGLNASGGVNGSHVLILQQSDVYAPSERSNARDLLGFNRDVVDTAVETTGSLTIFESIDSPSLINNMSLFVRLNNLGQNVMNAFTGNKSKIISHLTKLETQVGIVSYEPNNLVWLDLDNPADINLTDFDLSVNYINEQYAKTVVGDSIICLYFRDKPKM